MADWLAYGALIAVGLNVLVSVFRRDWRIAWGPRGGVWLWAMYVLHGVVILGAVLVLLSVPLGNALLAMMVVPMVVWQVVTVGVKLLRVDRREAEPVLEGG